MSGDGELTEEERDTALTSVAMVRLALQGTPEEEVQAKFAFLIDGRDESQMAELMYRLAELGAVILNGWYHTMLMIVPEESHEQLASPNGMLDDLVKVLVQGYIEEE